MDNSGTMNVLEAAQNLIDQKLHMVVGQPLRANNIVQVGAHQVRTHVHLFERLQPIAVRMEHVEQSDHVLVVHVLEQTQLAVRSFGVRGRLEGARQLFYGHLNVVHRVECRATCFQWIIYFF